MRAPGFVDAQAYPIVDRRRPADAASLTHDEIAVGRGLPRGMLVEPRAHVELVMGDRGTGIERHRLDDQHQRGRASCRDRVWQYVSISGVAGSVKTTNKKHCMS